MRKIEDECVGCTSVGLHCLGASCQNRNIVRFYCDRCGCEEKLYHYEGEELCVDCILEELKVVAGSEDL